MQNKTRSFLLAAMFAGASFMAMAQDAKVEKKEEQHVKVEVIGKDGKKHVIDEKFTGEMPESLKKKLEELKAQMRAEGKELNFNWNTDGGNAIFFKGSPDGALHLSDEGMKGKIKIITQDKDGNKEVIVEEFDGEMSEELKKRIAEIEAKCKADGKIISIDIMKDSGGDINFISDGELHKNGHIIIIKDGKTVIEEIFEGEMSEELKKQIELHKANGATIEIDKEAIQRIDVKEGADGKKIMIISTDDALPKDGEMTFSFNVSEEETIDENGNKIVKVFVFRNVVIQDVSENDESIPANLRTKSDEAFGEQLTELNFYPNPSNGNFNLKFNLQQEGATNIAIYNLSGQEIYSEQLGNFSGLYDGKIDLQGQSQGVYILKVSQGDKVLTKKIVVE